MPEDLPKHLPDPFQRGDAVSVVDDLIVKPGRQREVLQLFTQDYAEYAKARKLELADVFVLPPVERPADPARLMFIWRYPTLDDLWQARYGEENDDWLKAFWIKIDALVLSRSRNLGRNALMENMILPQGPGMAIAAPRTKRRQILFVKPEAALSEAQQTAWIEAAEAIVSQTGITQSKAGFHGAFSYLPGQFTWDVESDAAIARSEAELLSLLPGPATASEFVELGERVDGGPPDTSMTSGLKRTTVFRAGDDLTEDQLATLHKTVADWSRLPEIRNWAVSRVAKHKGPIAWTHCYEQEFDNLEAIMGPYLNHPFHWAVIDRLFHRESPTQMVYEYNHTIRPISASVIASIG